MTHRITDPLAEMTDNDDVTVMVTGPDGDIVVAIDWEVARKLARSLLVATAARNLAQPR